MKKILIIFIIAITAWNCSDDNAITPPSEFSFDKSHGILVTDTLYTTDDLFLQKDPVETGNATRLSVGRTADFETYFFIEFSELPEDTTEIDSVFILLNGLSKQALTDQTEMSLEIYKLNDEWDSSVNTDEKWHNYIPSGAPYKTHTITLEDSASYKIALDPELIEDWQTEENNKGLLFRAAETENQIIIDFGSFNSQNKTPGLIYSTKTDTSSIMDTLQVGLDATVFDYIGNIYDEERSNKNLAITSGYPTRSYLKFDFSTIPENSIINSAQLILEINDDNIYQNPGHSNTFFFRAITEAEDGLTVDSTFSYNLNVNYILFEDGNKIIITDDDAINFGQGYIQSVINDYMNFKWFSIQYFGESTLLDMIKLYGSDSPKGAHPGLIVQYLIVE